MLALVLAAAAAAATTLSPSEAATAYRQMLGARYATRATPVPAGGLSFEIDSARFRLESGELRAMEPVAGGRVTGVVFRGAGRLALELPDSRELDQFRRAAERPDATRLEATFDALVLRDGGGRVERLLEALGTAEPSGPFEPDALALERQEVWLERRLVDADAWVTRAMAGDGAEWALAEMRSPELGWIAVEFDPFRVEELQVAKWRPDELFTELWTSLDRSTERGPAGRPASVLRRQFDLLHAGIRVDLRERSRRRSSSSSADVQPRRARFEVELKLLPHDPEARSIAFELDPWTELAAVRDESGAELTFLRDHVGLRSAILDDQLWDNTTIVLLPEPIGAVERRLTFVYEGDILNYVGGRSWYPGEEDAVQGLHTATLEITMLPKQDLRAMGSLVASREDAAARYRRYEVARPVRVVTFAFADRFFQGRLETPGQPTVVVFSALGDTGRVAKSLAEDVSRSWRFFADRFGPGPATDELIVTSIDGSHGQAFEGFLHLAEETFTIESSGPSELFRAHEVAHQWWGHQVGWSGYRDQWLSEALAQFSAMLFVESEVKGGAELYREMVGTFAAAAQGESRVGRFQRRFAAPVNPRQWRRVGPIAVGFRASTADVRFGYQLQTYYRGALVLHMLRGLLRAECGDDRLMFSILGELAQGISGREPSTADFFALLARWVPGDWSWFEREWIEETSISTWTWSWKPGKSEDGRDTVVLDVAQEGVPPTFRMPVPVRIESAGGSREFMVLIDETRETVTLPLDGPAKRVVFNPDFAVLARTEKR